MIYDDEGGQANVDKGKVFGIDPWTFKNGWFKISSIVGLAEGSITKIWVMIFLALSEIGTCSGKL